jgi:hypothetical protein
MIRGSPESVDCPRYEGKPRWHCCVGRSQGAGQTDPVTSSGSSSVFAGFRFPREVISLAVRWYLRYGLPYRDVEELLAERCIMVDHVTIYRWVQRFTAEFVEAARPARHAPVGLGNTIRGASGQSGGDVVLVGESVEDLLPADPDLGEVDRFRRAGVSLTW